MIEPWDLIIGTVVSPFGRLGELKVIPLTDFPERFNKLRKVALRSQDGQVETIFDVEQVRHHKGAVLLKLKGIDSIDDAEGYRNYQVGVRQSERIRLPKGTYFVEDILGMEVFTTTGESLGTVREVLHGANDVYVTERAMIPAIHEIVKRIDPVKKQMIVEPIEGLLIEGQ